VTLPDNPAVYGQDVTFTATVTDTSGGLGTPTGSVQFSIDGTPYDESVNLVDGTASISDADSPAGSYEIAADYSPDDLSFLASISQSVPQVVTFADTTTTVDSGLTPSVYGQTVTFTAQVINSSPESAADPTGSVEFYIDGASYGSVPLDAEGKATITDDTLPAGTHQITAGFLPQDDNFGASLSEAPAPQVVTFADTTTTVYSGLTPSVYGQAVTFTAQVVNSSPESTADPTGGVEF
jgi:large repetitive protein